MEFAKYEGAWCELGAGELIVGRNVRLTPEPDGAASVAEGGLDGPRCVDLYALAHYQSGVSNRLTHSSGNRLF